MSLEQRCLQFKQRRFQQRERNLRAHPTCDDVSNRSWIIGSRKEGYPSLSLCEVGSRYTLNGNVWGGMGTAAAAAAAGDVQRAYADVRRIVGCMMSRFLPQETIID